MTITLPREQQEWLEEQVKAGACDSIDDAVASIVAQYRRLEFDELSWARPPIDEARAAVARGESFGKLDR